MSVEIEGYKKTVTTLLNVGDKFIYKNYLYMVVSKDSSTGEPRICAVVIDKIKESDEESKLNYYENADMIHMECGFVNCIRDMTGIEVIKVNEIFIKVYLDKERESYDK